MFQIACSNGQLGFGRRRRGIDSGANDPNKIFEVTMMTFLKLDNTTIPGEDTLGSKNLRNDIDELSRAFDPLSWSSSSTKEEEEPLPIQSTGDEPTFIYFNNSGHTHVQSVLFVIASAFLLFFYN